jgi:hypothetical protein
MCLNIQTLNTYRAEGPLYVRRAFGPVRVWIVLWPKGPEGE